MKRPRDFRPLAVAQGQGARPREVFRTPRQRRIELFWELVTASAQSVAFFAGVGVLGCLVWYCWR